MSSHCPRRLPFAAASFLVLALAGFSPGSLRAQQPNLLQNPGFESGTSSWRFFTSASGDFASVSPGFAGAKAGRVTITTTGVNMQLYQSGIALEPNTRYTLTFTAYSNRGRDLSVSVFKQVSPYTNYGLSNRVFNLTSGWQTFSVEFTTSGFSSVVSDGRLRFWFASYAVAGEVYYFDEVQLRKSGPTPPMITVEPADRFATAGQTATFALTAVGTSPLVYQWRKNGVVIAGATQTSYTTPPVSAADSGSIFSCVVTNGIGTDTSRTALLEVVPPLTLTTWYGETQAFGFPGDPVPAVNILGNLRSVNSVASFSYTVNGGTSRNLSSGPDTRRLARRGDFNIDIPTSTLAAGTNRVVVRAQDSLGNTLRDTVTVVYTSGSTWPLPYAIDWTSAPSIRDVAQVVDGLWTIDRPSGVLRILQPGYDRLVAIGETSWRDYEITVPVTVHAIDSSGFAPPSNGAGIGFLMRWPGHSDLPTSLAGMQPKTGYLPLGALTWYEYRSAGERLRIVGNDLQLLAEETTGRKLVTGVRYMFKARVETVSGVGGRYSIKVWPDGTPEPSSWDLTGQEALTDPQQGCVLLVAHHVDASFGAVTVTAIGSATYTLATSVSGSGSVSRNPNQPTYTPGQTVTVTATPSTGWVFDGWSGALSGTSNPAVITMNANMSVTASFSSVSPPSSIASDEFNAPVLDTGVWTFINPRADASFSMTGTQMALHIPAGISHDAWTGGNFAPRIMQVTANSDFEVETRFQSAMNAKYQIQGIIAEQNPSAYIRFGFVRDGTRTRVFAATFTDGVPTVRKDTAIAPASPLYLRVRREGSLWTQRYSYDGTLWYTAGVFTHALTLNAIGPYGGNAGSPAPAFTTVVDYFRNLRQADVYSPIVTLKPASSGGTLPAEFLLAQNFPNPFNPSTTISFGLPEPASVRLEVFDLLGRRVATLAEGELAGGFHVAAWDGTNTSGSDVGSGVYLYRLQASGSSGRIFTSTGRMMLVR